MHSERLTLMSPSPGTRRELLIHRFGTAGSGPKVYIQAGLHADEWPGCWYFPHRWKTRYARATSLLK